MAVLVDTTVWIDLFRGIVTPQVQVLKELIAARQRICICGPVLTEVLQGIQRDDEFRRTMARFNEFLFFPMNILTFVRAAEMYRLLRHRGTTVRKPIDCMIAAVCIEQNVPLLHNDRDFDPMEKHCGLRVVRPRGGATSESNLPAQ